MNGLVRKGNIICIVKRNEGENIDVFLNRANFIVSQKLNNNKSYNEIVILSNVYANMEHLKCDYSTTIKKKIDDMQKKCMIDV